VRAVVDTNVIAYHLMGAVALAAEVERFLAATENLTAPAIWEAELANTLWVSARAGVLTPGDALEKLSLASGLGIQSQSTRTLWSGALLRSLDSGVSVYDTLFVELAEREGVYLATYDRGLLRAFPELARRPGEITP
jgi:predicted nucleic acid-binding protein